MPTPEALPSSAQKFSRRKLLTVASSAAFLAACQGGTETGKGPGSPLTPAERGTLPPGVATAEGFPTYEISTATPYPSATNPESDKDATGFPTVEETATPIENDPTILPTEQESSEIPSDWTTIEYVDNNNIGFRVKYPELWDATNRNGLDGKYPYFIPLFKENTSLSPEFLVEWQPALNVDINYYKKQLINRYASSTDGSSTKIEEEIVTTGQGLEGLKLKIVNPSGSTSTGLIQYLLLTHHEELSVLWGIEYMSYTSGDVFNEEHTFQQFVDSFQPEVKEKSLPPDWITDKYSSQTRGFRVDVPADWTSNQKEENAQISKTFTIETPNGMPAEFVITSEPVINNDLDSYVENVERQYTEDVSINRGFSKILGLDAWNLEIDIDGIYRETYVFITPNETDEGKFYGWQISLTANPNAFDEIEDTFYQVINSFRITPTEN